MNRFLEALGYFGLVVGILALLLALFSLLLYDFTLGRFEVIPLLERVMGSIIRLVNSHS